MHQVFQGVILASRDRFMKNSPLGELPPFGGSVTSPEGYMLGLWVHECQRVFSDKMITLEDKAWVDGAIKELCKTNFAPDLTKQVSVFQAWSPGFQRDRITKHDLTIPTGFGSACLFQNLPLHPELVCIVVTAGQSTWPCARWMIRSQHPVLQTVPSAQVEEPLYFVDFLREPTFDNETGEVIDAHPSFYESIQGGLPDIRKRVEALQRKFNEESKAVKLELVLFQDALTHLMRISRLLAMDRGSVLLVGVGGSGKQSLSRLAAYIAGKLDCQPPCFRVVLGNF